MCETLQEYLALPITVKYFLQWVGSKSPEWKEFAESFLLSFCLKISLHAWQNIGWESGNFPEQYALLSCKKRLFCFCGWQRFPLSSFYSSSSYMAHCSGESFYFLCQNCWGEAGGVWAWKIVNKMSVKLHSKLRRLNST